MSRHAPSAPRLDLLLATRGSVPAEHWLDGLRAALPGHRVDLWHPGIPARYDLLVTWDPPQQLFDEQPQLRYVFNLGAGVDKLLALRLPASVRILRLQDAGMAVQMAEYVCHAAIRFYREFDAYAEQQARAIWNPRTARPRAEFPVGVMGLGALGRRVAQTVRQFDFPVNGWSRSRHAVDGVRCYAGLEELDAFLAATRILAVLLPLTPETQEILNAARLQRLRPGACLINVARGGLVAEDDLRAALDDGTLDAAWLDVTAAEPLPSSHWMWHDPRVALTPHVSAQTLPGDAIAQVVRAVEALGNGESLTGQVDRTRGY